jgi:signal peptidase I
MTEQKALNQNTPTQPAYGPPKSIIREYFEQGVITVIMALFLMTFIAQAVAVPTGSMQNTINIGDHLFVNKFVFSKPTPVLGRLLPTREIQRGDIIVFKLPSDPKINYVKRVIGLPGDTVHVKGRRVFVNGQELPEQRVLVKLEGHREDSQLPIVKVEPDPDNAPYRIYYDAEHNSDDEEIDFTQGMRFGVKEPVKVEQDSYFVMGDSRDNSLDSRYWGFVPRENIFARALYVHWSFNPRDPGSVSTGNRIIDMFKNAKWSRTGTAVK